VVVPVAATPLVFFFKLARKPANSGHKDKQPKETWLSPPPHARDNQLQVKRRSDPTIGRGDIEY
jgi:hypothetical protein